MFWHLGSLFELSPLDLTWGGGRCLRLFVSSQLWSLVLTSAILEALSFRRCWGKRSVCKHRSYPWYWMQARWFQTFFQSEPWKQCGQHFQTQFIFFPIGWLNHHLTMYHRLGLWKSPALITVGSRRGTWWYCWCWCVSNLLITERIYETQCKWWG